MAVATCPPGSTEAERIATLEPEAGKAATGMTVSVAFKPTPTTSADAWVVFNGMRPL